MFVIRDLTQPGYEEHAICLLSPKEKNTEGLTLVCRVVPTIDWGGKNLLRWRKGQEEK